MIRSARSFRALAVAASLCLTLTACPGEEPEPVPPPSKCAASETACGDTCCTAGEQCDAASSTCVKPAQCQAGETACGPNCCTAGQQCDAASSTCGTPSQCGAGETVCGPNCCTAGQLCDTASSTCATPSQCGAGETACGPNCCGADEQCDTASSTCGPAPTQLERCYSPASFPASAFLADQSYLVDADGYEYMANHTVDPAYAQSISIALWPLSASTEIVGTFDLAAEPFSYATCERCVLVIAGRSATDQKYYLAQAGTLVVEEAGAARIKGSLADVRLVEVTIDETTLATSPVEGGCELELPALAFEYGDPVDPRIAECFLPESFGPDQFLDYVYAYEANDSGYFYRAMELPAAPGIPNLTLFVEVYADGTGTFPLAGAEVNCASCYHLVIIEAQAVSGEKKDYVSASGNLVLTELSETAMVGRLENVRLVETVISGSQFSPVADGCSTFIESLAFDSANETP